MCLSNVYSEKDGERQLLYKNIADIRMEGGDIILTDIMGIRTSLEGSIRHIDLMENFVVVDCD